jgi:hypothetical protein
MVSRIDIGPDGGPYVAINENNNDLELQDINGNVIAVWDETAGQWDLNNNSLTNIDAIDASSVTADRLATGSRSAQYVTHEKSGTFYAEGPSGLISTGSNFSTVANDMFNSVPSASNRLHTLRFALHTESRAEITTTLTPPGKSVLDWHGAYKLAADTDMLEVSEGETKLTGNPDLKGDRANRTSGRAVYVSGGKRVWVEDLFIREFPGRAVDIDNVSGEFWVKNNDIGACDGVGVNCESADGWVVDNDIGNCLNGIRTRGGNTNIEGNAVFLCETGISSFGQYVVVCGNRSKENEQTGYDLGLDEGTVIGNVAKNNGQDTSADNKNRVGYFIKGSGTSWQGNVSNDDQSTTTQVYGASFVTNGENVFDGFIVQGQSSSAYNFSPSSSDKTGVNNPTI